MLKPRRKFSYRTTTLNDIHRIMGLNQKSADEQKRRRQDQFPTEGAVDYKEPDYEEGDVTGFMVEKPMPSSGINSFDVSSYSAFFSSRCYPLAWKNKVKANAIKIFSRLVFLQQFSYPQASAGAKTGKCAGAVSKLFLFTYF
jgi:hypothetical protein